MSANMLEPGFAGRAAPSPKDEVANPPVALPHPGPSVMASHFASQEDQARARYEKVKELQGQVAATRKEMDGLLALGDTVTVEDVVNAASGMVAAGIPAPEVAGQLADMPEGKGQLEGWVKEQDAGVRQRQQQVQAAMVQARHALGVSAMKSLIGHSAEAHFAKRKLAAAKLMGNA